MRTGRVIDESVFAPLPFAIDPIINERLLRGFDFRKACRVFWIQRAECLGTVEPCSVDERINGILVKLTQLLGDPTRVLRRQRADHQLVRLCPADGIGFEF
jgi:hypothetical protein